MGLNNIALAHLVRHKGKSVLIILGLATAVAAFVAVMSLTFSLRTTLDGRLARYGASLIVIPQNPQLSLEYGGVTVATAGSAQMALLDPSAVTRVQNIKSKKSLAAVLPVVLRAVNISGADYLAIGTDVASSARVKPWWKVEGTLPAGGDQVLLGLKARNKLRADTGTSLRIGGKQFVVSGVLQETGGEEDNAVIMDRAALAEAAGANAAPNMIEVAVTDSGMVEQVGREIQEAVPGVDVRSVKKSLEFNARANSSLASIGLGATILIILIATLIVVLTMLTEVRERQKEIGVLRALGFRARDVMGLMFRESLLLSAVAAAVGIALGVLGALYGPKIIPSLDLNFAASIPVIVGGALLAIVLAAIATVYPALMAARLDPAIALRKL
ncbi:MAG: ABC transporter permease [Actinobacteria bacterium]|nr:ABC transporter permease [Actinomycetota bacterium]